MGCDVLIPPRRSTEDGSLASFFRRRFGQHACERVMEPLMAGIYAGDAEQMSLRATFPRFYGGTVAWQRDPRDDGGPSRPRAPSDGRPRHTMFVTLKHGLADLVAGLTGSHSAGRRRAQIRSASRSGPRPVASGGPVDVRCGVFRWDGAFGRSLGVGDAGYVSAGLVRPLSPSLPD